ncbi:aldehyde oxidase [candidate division KSB3 bacterium]|uniref:Aldehyde oxidase n=1 Tax=candidate division KSB3 bacterium TaxID=2044937 RepID=A0A2G6EAJ0_9BACT|nr:MAG: aldehyde oxidase [candidate division KSB3 bacterium]PIE30729.1 MAG: aldehyde oxidase [candidate division KSB3 bacterium]
MRTEQLRIVHSSVEKVDGVKLVTGAAKYTDDFAPPGLLHAKILFSPHPHARIVSINTEDAKALPGVQAVLSYKDVKAVRHTKAGQSYPEPSPYDRCILDEKVRFIGDRVAVVAAESLNAAEQALEAIDVEYELLPAVLDMEEAMKPGAAVIHDEEDATGIYDASRNIAAYKSAELGNVEQALQAADLVIEREYRTQRQKHCALETHGSMAYLDENERLVIVSSTQVPFHTRRQLAYLLEMPMSRIRVIKPRIGGGFGNKQGMMSCEDVTAVLALKTRRPVKLVYTRGEEFHAGYCRHPEIVRLKTGVMKDGTIVAHDMRVIADTGAYGDHALSLPSSTGKKIFPLYPTKNFYFESYGVYTNLPVSGAFRGYGAIQGFFAMESQLDEIAKELGWDPLELRQKNMIKAGGIDPAHRPFGTPNERKMASYSLDECIRRGADAIGWHEKHGKPGEGVVKRGIGMACAMQGSGIAMVDWGGATLKLNDDGSFSLFVGATDLGTGSDTVLTQIAAECLGVDMQDISILSSDTDLTPFDVGAYASSTTYVSGGAVKKAAELMRERILQAAGKMMGLSPEHLHCGYKEIYAESGERAALRDVALYATYTEKEQLTVTASNMSETSPSPFSAHFAEIEVNTETGRLNVLKLVSAVDCGVAINPVLAEGQVEGAVTQGLGFTLFEEMVFEHGKLMNPNFADYKVFNAFDMPELETILVESYEASGPYGAKSVGEVPINGPAPAIANALYDAIGIRMYDLPLTQEKVLKAIQSAKR